MADAITLVSDMKVYDAEFNAGVFEALFLNTNIFNGASGNAVILNTQVHPGNYLKKAYFSRTAGLVARQNLASTAAVDSLKMAQVEEAAVKVHRRIGPIQWTDKAFNMAGIETPGGSFTLGRQVGDAVLADMVSTAVIALNAAVAGAGSLTNDITTAATKTANIAAFLATKAKWGDQFNGLAASILHSKPFFDLQADGLNYSALESVAGSIIQGNQKNVLGPMVIVDDANLVNAGAPNTYNTLLLKAGACILRQSELQKIVIQTHVGNEQLLIEMQGEYAVTVGIDGMTWDVTNGGANPDNTALAVSTNWDKVRTDVTGLPFAKLLSQ